MRKRFFALCMVFILSAAQFCFADDSGVVILSVSFSAYQNEYGLSDESLVVMTVCFTAPESVTQLTVLLAEEEIAQVSESAKNKIIYADQVTRPLNDTISFVLAKDRFAACVPAGADHAQMCLKIGGNGAAPGTTSVIYSMASPVPGDLNGDGAADSEDALLILRYEAELIVFTKKQIEIGDVTQDGMVDVRDAAKILRSRDALPKTSGNLLSRN